MDVFALRDHLIEDYGRFTRGFFKIRDKRIGQHVEDQLRRGLRWPDPWVALNPRFEPGGGIHDLVAEGLLHERCRDVFRVKRDQGDRGEPLILHRHQREAVEVARTGASYVLTTGTGSGKSLAYIVPIVDRVLREGSGQGVRAIVVYPMNALANSQLGELSKFLTYGFPDGRPVVTFKRYTGQESDEEKRRILGSPPDIILTNYVMLELMLTRPRERQRLISAANGKLAFLVLDELHTYRGRQGADVAMLVRRVRDACAAPAVQCVGTSATMASGGTFAEQRAEVAKVASRLFGAEVTPDRVIGETLARTTVQRHPEDVGALAMAVEGPRLLRTYDEFRGDPLAAWVEDTFGLRWDAAESRWIRQHPTTVPAAARELAKLTGCDEDACTRAIIGTLLLGARIEQPGPGGRKVFAFRLHQFLSKGDTAYVSAEPEAVRHITTRYQTAVPEQPEKLLFPLAFCRDCGQEYLVVARADRDGEARFDPRVDRLADDDGVAGYLYISGDYAWPQDRAGMVERLPESWLVDDDGQPAIDPAKDKGGHLPEVVWLRPDGTRGHGGDGVRAAYVRSPFRFCLRCGVSYESARGSDFAKLASLGSEGRSSATTVLSASIVRYLRGGEELPPEARKLLAFSDNRQDASLQAGHFNDFVQVGLLRAALHAAAAEAGSEGLTHEVLAHRVVAALGLDPAEYATNPTARYAARDIIDRALRRVVEYRLYQDLERGWRITMPNLEQTGLLRISYASLDAAAADAEVWQKAASLDDAATGAEVWQKAREALTALTAGGRAALCGVLLDELRRSLAVDAACLTDPEFDSIKSLSDQNLVDPWALGEDEKLTPAGIAWPRSRRRGEHGRRDLFLSGRSAMGRHLRRMAFPGHDRLTVAEAQAVIRHLLRALTEVGLVQQVRDPSGPGDVPGYQVRAAALVWRAGPGTHRAEDPLRVTRTVEAAGEANRYFVEFYRTLAGQLGGLHAAEHTAQVPPTVRLAREERFRDADLPILYCSPTMELGVDIADLNAVLMRNVPPTPANYAQRSGRAGRSGQPALVVTYCTAGSGHDQYYFRQSDRMVAGVVAPPRLDLTNEDLLRAHVQAIWLAETGEDLKHSLTDLLDATGDQPGLDLQPTFRAQLDDPGARRRAKARAAAVLRDLERELAGAGWWDADWLDRVIDGAVAELDRACTRWRELYRAALTEAQSQQQVILSAHADPEARRSAEGRRRDAEGQLRLLRADDEDLFLSDFYSYRYFASEGFLPGYSFPRLPLAAYLPGTRRSRGREGGDYLQRPRFVAISEFGPGALVYHEGARFVVNRVQLPIRDPAQGSEVLGLESAKRCGACGYHHQATLTGPDLCDNCEAELRESSTNLLRLQTVYTRRRERISSDEEERRRAGFKIVTSFRFGQTGRRRAEATAGGEAVAALVYGDTATIRRTNVGFVRSSGTQERGFYLDVRSGRWVSRDAAQADDGLAELGGGPKRLVIPYVEDTRNALTLRPAPLAGHGPLDVAAVATLQYALKRAIEACFDLEDSELAAEPLPSPAERSSILLYESAEGGAGVLRRLVAEPDQLARVARRALELLHFDPDSGADLGSPEAVAGLAGRAAVEGAERCERACYDCLLSYTNQRDHRLLDRGLVVGLLRRLAGARVDAGGPELSPEAEFARLLRLCDSELERMFLRILRQYGYWLPADAQRLLADAGVRPDFTYGGKGRRPVAVFVDGPLHDRPERRAADADDEERLLDAGWGFLRFRHDEQDRWAERMRDNEWVFGPGTGRR